MERVYCNVHCMTSINLYPLFIFFSLLFVRADTTRISFTIPLRESFGFPFLFAQIAFITYFLKKNASSLAQVFSSTSIDSMLMPFSFSCVLDLLLLSLHSVTFTLLLVQHYQFNSILSSFSLILKWIIFTIKFGWDVMARRVYFTKMKGSTSGLGYIRMN